MGGSSNPGAAPAASATLPLGPPYGSLDDALASFRAVEQALRERHDRRAVFLTAYIVITQEIKRRVEQNRFADPGWVAGYGTAFANFYRRALADFEAGNIPAVPKAWQVSFTASKNGAGLVIHDLLLGVNAHINHDLALALNQVSIDPDRAKRYQDHCAVNQALAAATDRLKQAVETTYSPGLELVDRALSAVDDTAALFSVEKAREAAWGSAVALANARDDEERAKVRAALNDWSAVLAQLILAPAARHPAITSILHKLEETKPWWQHVTVASLTVEIS